MVVGCWLGGLWIDDLTKAVGISHGWNESNDNRGKRDSSMKSNLPLDCLLRQEKSRRGGERGGERGVEREGQRNEEKGRKKK